MYNLGTAISYLPLAELAVSPRIAATKNAMIIYGHKGVIKFTNQEIWINTCICPLVICGRKLRVSKIDCASVTIVGVITSISFKENRK